MVDFLTAGLIGLVAGFLVGYLFGAKAAGKKFYKHPSTAWRIRGR